MTTSEKLALSVLSEASSEVRSLVIRLLAETLQPSSSKPKSSSSIKSTRSGSVRHSIHQILAHHGTLRRRDLIYHVGALRDEDPCRLERPIDEALRTDRTGRIHRLGRGRYGYVASEGVSFSAPLSA